MSARLLKGLSRAAGGHPDSSGSPSSSPGVGSQGRGGAAPSGRAAVVCCGLCSEPRALRGTHCPLGAVAGGEEATQTEARVRAQDPVLRHCRGTGRSHTPRAEQEGPTRAPLQAVACCLGPQARPSCSSHGSPLAAGAPVCPLWSLPEKAGAESGQGVVHTWVRTAVTPLGVSHLQAPGPPWWVTGGRAVQSLVVPLGPTLPHRAGECRVQRPPAQRRGDLGLGAALSLMV